jgi:hypothetical protein
VAFAEFMVLKIVLEARGLGANKHVTGANEESVP